MDEKVSKQEVSAEDQAETDKLFETFVKLAGEDGEIDWQELQHILNTSLGDLNRNGDAYHKKDIGKVDATPPNAQTESEENFLTQLLGLICGHFCKDSPLAEIIPKPAQHTPVLATFADFTKAGFSKDICRSMVAMLDKDRSGKLCYDEFKVLWSSLRNWKNAWTLFDTDKSGAFSGFELGEAIEAAGYNVNKKVLNALMNRYGNKHGEIQFDDFLMCAMKLKTMMNIFNEKDKSGPDTATFSLQEWLEDTLYT